MKTWWQSKTLWFNVIAVMLAAAETQLNLIQPMLPVSVYTLMAFALPVVNMGLRLITTTALKMEKQDELTVPPAA